MITEQEWWRIIIFAPTFKLLYGRENREEDPNSGADHLVGGDYCGVIVEPKNQCKFCVE